MRSDIEKLAKPETAIGGGPPYDAYTVFFNVIREPVNFGGGLEHSAAQFDIMPKGAFADATGNFGSFMVPLMSHEYFHLWNVKRMRPAEMWPYDYHGEQYTPLLWWSEGVTDYYADLTNVRSGLWTPEQFLNNAASDMQQVESAPEPWSEEDGSVATWINEVFVDRKSTRLNSSHSQISYAVFCLKKKKSKNAGRKLTAILQHEMLH